MIIRISDFLGHLALVEVIDQSRCFFEIALQQCDAFGGLGCLQAAGFTQIELAQKLGRHQSFVAKYEGGERRLDIIELLSITQLLNIDERRLIKSLKTEL